MPHWGVALALGANINRDIDPERGRLAYEAIQRAQRLAARAPEAERAYVAALARRYSNDPNGDPKRLATQYAEAMAALVKTYPGDLDAATLYAESLMNLRPWQLWTLDGSPQEGTLAIVETLETVLQKNPNHLGANHYYIHATEASLSPDRALGSAQKLETLAPAAGHLVHMPAHVYMRTGNYTAAVTANARGADADRRAMTEGRASGHYAAMYYNHNLDFLAAAAMMSGQFAEAAKAADEVVTNVTPMLAAMPMLEPIGARKQWVLLRFARWADVLQLPAPAAAAPVLTTLHHFARGVAHAALGAVPEAERERSLYAETKRTIPADAPWLFNSAARMLAVTGWRQAVAAEDALNYDEPPDWYYPTRESLGAALLKAQRLDDAERVFREDLERNPNNPRSLFGLWQTLRVTDPRGAATLVMQRRFQQAWQNADVPLSLTDF
jgi:tetratricopeptide (TPR) repeat protein